VKDHPLRDLKKNTELLILVELLQAPTARLKDIAEKLGVTVQAVSQYIAVMKKEGLLKERAGLYRATRKGMQILQEHFSSIKTDVDTILRRISVIDRCVAIAGSSIQKGQNVGLVMEDGLLFAFPGQSSSSTGIALEPAAEGDDLLVGNLEGILELELGKLLLLELPSSQDGGAKTANVDLAKERIEEWSPGLLAAGDPSGAALLMKASGEMLTIHAPIESSMSALSKGVDVVFCGTRESIESMLESVSELKRETGYEIGWRSFRL